MHVKGAKSILLIVLASCGIGRCETASELYAVAAGHYSFGKYDLAIEDFQLFLQRYPADERFGDAQFFLAEAYMQNADYPHGAKAFQAFCVHNSSHRFSARGIFRWGEAAMFAEQANDAIRLLRQFNQQNPDHELNEYALAYLGRMILKDQNDAVAAREFLLRSLQDFPDGKLADEVQIRLGIMDYSEKKYEDAIKHFQWIIEKSPKSKHRIQATYWIGINRLALNDYVNAVESFSKVFKQQPDHPLAESSLFYAAESFRARGESDNASRLYRKCLDNDSSKKWNEPCLIGLLEIEIQNEDFRAVDLLAQQYASRFPSSPHQSKVQFLLGKSLLKRERYDDAFIEFQRALDPPEGIELDRRLADKLIFYSALSQLAKGNTEQAIVIMENIDDQRVDFRSKLLAAKATSLEKLQRYTDAANVYKDRIEFLEPGLERDRCRARWIAALVKAKQLPEAEKNLESFFNDTSDINVTLQAANVIAEVHFQNEEFGKAQPWFHRLADSGSAEFVFRGLAGLGWSYFRQNQFEQAAAAFDRILKLNATHDLAAEAAFMKARSLDELGKNPESAISAYQAVYEHYSKSSYVAEALFAQAKLLDQSGSKQYAIAILQKIATENPTYRRIDAVLYDWAWGLTHLNRIDDAMAIFTRIHLEHRESKLWADATYRLANDALQRKDLSRAAALLKQLQTIGTDDSISPHASLLMARLQIENSNWKDAANILKSLVANHAEHEIAETAQFWLAEAYYRDSKLEQAKTHFEQLRNQKTDASSSWTSIVDLRTAQILASEGKWDEAKSIAENLLDDNSDFQPRYEAEYVLGRCYAGKGFFNQARKHYQTVLSDKDATQSETAAMAQWMIGETYFHQKDFSTAVRAYLRVEILYDFPAWRAAALLQAGKCYEHLDEAVEALRLYERIGSNYASTSYASEAAKRIETLRAANIITVETSTESGIDEVAQ